MATENFELSKAQRQNVLATAVRFAGSDVGADFAATSVKFEVPPNAVLLRGNLLVLTADGGTSPTYNVGTSADEDAYGQNLDIDGTPASVPLTGIPAKLAEGTTLAVSHGTGTIAGDGDFLLVLEYAVEGRGNEVFG